MSSIKGKWIEDGSIGANHILNNAVTTTKLNANAVTTAKILDSNVTTSKLDANSVTTDKIVDGNVTDAKLVSTFIKADGTVPMAANLNFSGSHKVINLANPTNNGDAVNYITMQDAIQSAIVNNPWQDSVLGRLNTPPTTPNNGDRYLITATATGVWSGKENNIAEWNGSSWDFSAPQTGWLVSSLAPADSNKLFFYGGVTWEVKEFEGTVSGIGSTIAARAVNVNVGNGLLVDGGNNINVKPDIAGGTNIANVINVSPANGIGVKIDDVTIEANVSSQLGIKNSGVTTPKLADVSVTNGKLAGGIDDTKLNTITAANKVAASAIDGTSGSVNGRLKSNLGFDANSNTIQNVANPVNNTDAANKQWVTSQLSTGAGMTSEQFVLSATDITNKYVKLAIQPFSNSAVALYIVGGTTQHYENDYTIVFANPDYRLSWNGKALDGLLAAGDTLRVTYSV